MYENVALNKEKIEKELKKRLGFGITYHGENDEGRCILSGKFEDPKIEEEKNKLIEGKFNDNLQEVFRCYQFRNDGISYSVERKNKDGFIKESYYQPRSEEEKQQIRKRQEINRQKRELEEDKKVLEQQNQNKEKSQNENSPNSDKKDQPNLSQKIDNKDNNSKNIYYGIGVIGLVLVVVSMVVILVKKRKNKLK